MLEIFIFVVSYYKTELKTRSPVELCSLLITCFVVIRPAECGSYPRYKYLGKRLPFQDADIACTKLGKNWFLPSHLENTELSRFMEQNRITRTWLDVRRRILSTWTWTDGVKFQNRSLILLGERPDRPDLRCGALSDWGSEVYATNCLSLHNFLCTLKGTTVLPVLLAVNWYEAEYLCHRIGGNLAVLKNTFILNEARRALDMINKTAAMPSFHIGLSREIWLSVKSGEKLLLPWKGLSWFTTRHKCVVYIVSGFQTTGDGVWSWDCLFRSDVICVKEKAPETEFTSITVAPLNKQEEKGHKTLIYVIIGIPSALCSLAILVCMGRVICKAKKTVL